MVVLIEGLLGHQALDSSVDPWQDQARLWQEAAEVRHSHWAVGPDSLHLGKEVPVEGAGEEAAVEVQLGQPFDEGGRFVVDLVVVEVQDPDHPVLLVQPLCLRRDCLGHVQ